MNYRNNLITTLRIIAEIARNIDWGLTSDDCIVFEAFDVNSEKVDEAIELIKEIFPNMRVLYADGDWMNIYPLGELPWEQTGKLDCGGEDEDEEGCSCDMECQVTVEMLIDLLGVVPGDYNVMWGEDDGSETVVCPESKSVYLSRLIEVYRLFECKC